jgi:hypothetical protein
VIACIGEPISWPRLERFAVDSGDSAIAAHIAACPACRQCLAQIRDDVVELRPLVLGVVGRDGPAARAPAEALEPQPPDPARRSDRAPRRRWLAPMFAAAAAAAAIVLLLVAVRRPAAEVDGFAAPFGVKGVGEVTLALVRERGGAIELDARRYAPGDRWKVMLSCPPHATTVAIDVSVADGVTTDHPLAPAQVACGNRVVVPGAFTVTGTRANRVCATVVAGTETGTACATLRPE